MCQRTLDVTQFQWNQGKCMSCKQAWDSLYGICRRQGKLEWLNKQKESPEALSALVKNYQSAQKLYSAGETQSKWSLVEYKQLLETAAMIDIVDGGQMMNEEAYITHATASERDRPLSRPQARAQWAQWSSDPEATGMMYQGTAAEGNLKFRIATGTEVNFKSQVKLTKQLEMLTAKKKNANAEDLQAKLCSMRHHLNLIKPSFLDLPRLEGSTLCQTHCAPLFLVCVCVCAHSWNPCQPPF